MLAGFLLEHGVDQHVRLAVDPPDVDPAGLAIVEAVVLESQRLLVPAVEIGEVEAVPGLVRRVLRRREAGLEVFM
jgi:hypothetical protein